MNTSDEIKKMVREKYGEIVVNEKKPKETSCCGPASTTCCGPDADFTLFSEDYSQLEGYNPEADYGLGCGLPTEYANIKKGDTVVDLGSGAGNDCFVARQITGEAGHVIGVDMTPNMIDKARENAQTLKLRNVEFRLGEIENLPIVNEQADVVVSNCVLNLVPDKKRALSETFRILKRGGRFSVSDIVTYDEIPSGLREEAALYAGCVSGALIKDEYTNIIKEAGFVNITIQKERKIDLPDEMLAKYLNKGQIADYKNKFKGIASISIYAEKP